MSRTPGFGIRAACGVAALVLATAAAGRAWAQAPSPPAGALDRAEGLIQGRSFAAAEVVIKDILAADPSNRRARELLAYAFECTSDLKGERRVRSALAAEHPEDARIQFDYGRVLERSGEAGGALRAYRRARELGSAAPGRDLDAAIERTRYQAAVEVATPVMVMSDPQANASRVDAGAAIPAGPHRHVALLGTRYAATATNDRVATASGALALSLVENGAGRSWSVGPRLHAVARPGSAREDVGVGGVMTAAAALGPTFEIAGRADYETPWDEAAVALLHGGSSTSAEGHLYAHGASRRLLLQMGPLRRRLSIFSAAPGSDERPEAWQSLWLAGADVVVWRAAPALHGEMLDESLTAPRPLPSALTIAYRHYGVSAEASPGFAAVIGIAPRASVDEASVNASAPAPGGRVGAGFRAGAAFDAARHARVWSAGATLVWAPRSATHVALAYDEASELSSGLLGRRRTGSLSLHVDL